MTTAIPGGDDVAGGYGDLPGLGVDDHIGLAVEDGGSSGDDEDLEEEAPVSMEHRVKMAEIWVANPRSSHHWTSGAGGGVMLELQHHNLQLQDQGGNQDHSIPLQDLPEDQQVMPVFIGLSVPQDQLVLPLDLVLELHHHLMEVHQLVLHQETILGGWHFLLPVVTKNNDVYSEYFMVV
ncbi:hypothetical protein ZWY2020_013675 [Hordeum vulgare]|nr:hypothetical protein ZWY2020_013675 [Hordeum vulgare]